MREITKTRICVGVMFTIMLCAESIVNVLTAVI